MPATEMVVMVAIVSALALSFMHLVRLARTAIMHKTARRMIDHDPSIADAMMTRLGEATDRAGDDRLATILIALGIAMIAGSIVINDPKWVHYGAAAALFPLIVGTALWLRLVLVERARRRAGRQ